MSDVAKQQTSDTSERVARNKRIVGGGLASASNVGLFIAYQLISLPLFLNQYGSQLYSDWLILFGLPALLSISDLGIPQVVGSQMTMLRSGGRITEAGLLYGRMRRYAWYWLAGLICILLILTWSLNIAAVLHLQALSERSTQVTLTALILWLSINLYWGTYSAGYQASKLFPRNLSFIAATRAAESTVIIGSVAAGLSIPVLAIALLGTRVIFWALLAHDFAKQTVWLNKHVWNQPSTETPSLKRLASPALASLAFPAGTALQNQGMLLVVNWRASAASVIAVNTIRTVTNTIYQFNTFIKAGVTPELSDRFGVADISTARSITVKVSAVIIVGNVVIAILIGCLGPEFLAIWSGQRIDVSIAVMSLFALSSATDCIWHSMANVAQAKNVHQRIAFAYLAACIIALPISYVLLPSLGIAAVALSLFTTSVIVNAVTVPHVCQLLEITVGEYVLSSRDYLGSLWKKGPKGVLRAFTAN